MCTIYCELNELLNLSQNQKLSNPRIVFVGRANAGKSSLLNAILQQQRVIVSEIAGTTRDSIAVDHLINNQLVTIVDTAGIHHSKDRLELLGIDQSKQELQQADLIVHLIAVDEMDHHENTAISNLIGDKPFITVYSKADLLTEFDSGKIYVSAYKQEFSALLEAIKKHLEYQTFFSQNYGLILPDQIYYLQQAKHELQTAILGLAHNGVIDLLVENIKLAYHYINNILGLGENDFINDLFANFCVGK